jgi:hypothetical protein
MVYRGGRGINRLSVDKAVFFRISIEGNEGYRLGDKRVGRIRGFLFCAYNTLIEVATVAVTGALIVGNCFPEFECLYQGGDSFVMLPMFDVASSAVIQALGQKVGWVYFLNGAGHDFDGRENYKCFCLEL